MNKKINSFLIAAIRSLFVFILVVVIFYVERVHGQTFILEGREYRFVDNVWYNFTSGEQGDQIVPERLIVRLQNHGDLSMFNFTQLGLSNVSVISEELFGGYYVVEVAESLEAFAVASTISDNPIFDYVEFDAIGEFHNTPNDPLYTNQWNLPQISMPSAWDITTGSSSVILAIIDTGTDYNHEDLDGNIWVNPAEDRNGNGRPDFYPYWVGGDLDFQDNDNNGKVDDLVGWDYYSGTGDNNPFPSDGEEHGTAVAGIATAQTNNYENGSYRGVAGVAGGWGSTKGAEIMILRYYYFDSGPYASSAAQCIRYAAKNGAKVINFSSGWEDDYPYFKSAVDSAAIVYDCVFVASAGNNGGNGSSDLSIRYPARYSTTIAVGASIADDSRWVTGGNNGSAIGPELDVVAPGGASIINTTDITGSAGNNSGDYYSTFSGTSASAPHVAGLAALIRSEEPSLSWSQVRDVIRASADKVSGMGSLDFTNEYGYGRINAYNAVGPQPPTNLYVSGYQGGMPQINWTASISSNIDHYEVWCYEVVGPPYGWQLLTTTSATSWIDSRVTIDFFGPEDEYCYKAKTVNTEGLISSYYSNSDCILV